MNDNSFFVADAHCDTLSRIYDEKESLLKNSGHLDLIRMQKANLKLQIFAVWMLPETLNPFNKACEIIKYFNEEKKRNAETISRIDYILSIEGGHILEGKLENLETLYDMGVCMLTLTWNGENEIGYGGVGAKDLPLKEFGLEVLKALEQKGMFIDVSHLSEKGFWSVMENTFEATPIFATHSNAKTVCDHPRNLTDKQIKAIIKRNGYIGINLYPKFLGGDSLELMTNHIKHIISLGGEKVLGFGCDFDGVDDLPKGINGVESFDVIIKELEKHFDNEFVADICGRNLKRVLNR